MKYPSTYLKMRVLGALEFADGRSLEARMRSVAAMTFTDEDGSCRQFTHKTINTWYYRYKKYGITAINSRARTDKGTTRKVTPEEVHQALLQVLPLFKQKNTPINKLALYRVCIEKGILRKENIAQTTFYRFIREYELLKNENITSKRRLAFSMQYANELWQADTMYGPYIKNGPGHTQTKLIAFIDDASRVVCHGEFFFTESISTLTQAFKAAFYKRGIPEQLYVDNGSIYTSKEITLICARLGIILRHAPVRDGAAKGKIERFFRTLRSQFLAKNLDLSSLEILNAQFISWLEDDYNTHTHSVLGMRPIDRFGMDLSRIRFLPPNENNDELFFNEEPRKVKKDNTFSLQNVRYEAPRDFRRKTIQVRFNRQSSSRVIVFYKNERMGDARPVDFIANGLLKRTNRKENNS